jgi:hypothetical protein
MTTLYAVCLTRASIFSAGSVRRHVQCEIYRLIIARYDRNIFVRNNMPCIGDVVVAINCEI